MKKTFKRLLALLLALSMCLSLLSTGVWAAEVSEQDADVSVAEEAEPEADVSVAEASEAEAPEVEAAPEEEAEAEPEEAEAEPEEAEAEPEEAEAEASAEASDAALTTRDDPVELEVGDRDNVIYGDEEADYYRLFFVVTSTEEGNRTVQLGDGSYGASVEGEYDTIEIPSKVTLSDGKEYTVTGIGALGLCGFRAKTVVIPDTVTRLGEYDEEGQEGSQWGPILLPMVLPVAVNTIVFPAGTYEVQGKYSWYFENFMGEMMTAIYPPDGQLPLKAGDKVKLGAIENPFPDAEAMEALYEKFAAEHPELDEDAADEQFNLMYHKLIFDTMPFCYAVLDRVDDEHKHAFTCTGSGDTVKVKCSAEDCPYTTNKEYTATLKAPDKVYDGKGAKATLSKSAGFPREVECGSVSYEGKVATDDYVTVVGSKIIIQSGKTKAYKSSEAPTEVGTYTASVQVGGKTISTSFEIKGQDPILYVADAAYVASIRQLAVVFGARVQYILLNASTREWANNWYVARGAVSIKGPVKYGKNVKLILCDGSSLRITGGLYNAGSDLTIYGQEGQTGALTVRGADGGAALKGGDIIVKGGKLNVLPGKNGTLVEKNATGTITFDEAVVVHAVDKNGKEVKLKAKKYPLSALAAYQSLSTATITQSKLVKAPKAKKLTANGKAQTLVTAGSAKGGTMKYAVTRTKQAPKASAYSAKLPTAKNAGTYWVWYLVQGNETHANTMAKCVKVSIAKAINRGLRVSQKGSQLKVQWASVKGASYYEVYVQYCGKDFAKKPTAVVRGWKNTSAAVTKLGGKKLDMKKNFRVLVKAYQKKDGKAKLLSQTVEGHIAGRLNVKYTNAKGITLKKSSLTLRKGKTAQIQAKTELVNPKRSQLGDNHAREFRYTSSNTSVARVNAKGVVTGRGKGSCTVFVFARNGLPQKVTVTVK